MGERRPACKTEYVLYRHAQSIRPLWRLKFLVQTWIGEFRRVSELEEGKAHCSLA